MTSKQTVFYSSCPREQLLLDFKAILISYGVRMFVPDKKNTVDYSPWA